MLHRHCDGKFGAFDPAAEEMLAQIREIAGGVEAKYRARNTSQVVRDVVEIADLANRYFQDAEPWKGVKENLELAHMQLTTAAWAGKLCVALLKPIVPEVAAKTAAMLGLGEAGFTFDNLLEPLEEGATVAEYPRLFERVDPKKVQAMVDASVQGDAKPKAKAKAKKKAASDGAKAKSKPAESKKDGPIDYDHFMSVDLRVARVLLAEDVEGADKLLRVKLDVGDLGERQVFAGLKPHVSAEQLSGKLVVVVANLAPRKMRFGLSEGMILAGGDEVPAPVFVPDGKPGDRVR